MRTMFKTAALALAAGGMTATAPVAAHDFARPAQRAAAPAQIQWQDHDRGRHYGWDRGRGNRDRYNDRYYSRSSYGEPVYRDTRVWRGRDGNTYCRKKDGTTGLIIGGAVGALLGREVDRSGDRALGTILGGAAGALLGKKIDSGTRCR